MNATTLNMTTLDGGVIIKKGTAPAPPSGGESGGGDWHYFDVSGLDLNAKLQSLQTAMTYKVRGENIESMTRATGVVMSVGFGYVIPIKTEEIKAVGMDYSTEVRIGEQSMTIGQSITSAPWYGQAPEITKEEFYTLD